MKMFENLKTEQEIPKIQKKIESFSYENGETSIKIWKSYPGWDIEIEKFAQIKKIASENNLEEQTGRLRDEDLGELNKKSGVWRKTTIL